jgi:thioredoxin reductase (NADPH)
MTERARDLVIVGAGPSGLATAIAAHEAGLAYEVVEKGVLVNSIYNFPRHMTFFTTADLLEIGGLPFVSPYEKPTQSEGLKYYRRVAEIAGLRVCLGEEVVAVARAGKRFRVSTRTPDGPRERTARNLVFATGYYDWPNRLGVPGEDLPHVSHYYTEPHAYFQRDVVVVGGKNSAAITALELYRAGARVTLVHRGTALSGSIKYWVKPDIENRIKEGAIAARFGARVTEIREREVVIRSGFDAEEILPASHVFLLTGYHPDTRLLEAVGVKVDPATLVPEHDPETLQTNVKGVYLAGATASGRFTSRIFIENGKFHGGAIVKSILASATSRSR